MPSPFPGMDPFLEGPLWPDVLRMLAVKLSQQLTPQLRPKYVARLTSGVVVDQSPELEVGLTYPMPYLMAEGLRDISQIDGNADGWQGLSHSEIRILASAKLRPVKVPVVALTIRDAHSNRRVTHIEILSPVNKHELALSVYRAKRDRIRRAGVHLLEIDLIRRGTRPLNDPQISGVPYLMTLTRAGSAIAEVWPVKLADNLPVLPVPLREPDPDARLDLGAAFSTIYDEAGYDLSIDYHATPPPPALSSTELAWMQTLIPATAQ